MVIKESKQTYKLFTPFEYFNEHSNFKPQGYQAIINMLTDRHLVGTDQGLGELINNRYAWVIVSLTLDILKPIKKTTQVKAKTWYSGRRGPFFRREYQITDQDDEPLFVGASYTILMDMHSRTIFRQKEIPFDIFEETNIHLVEAIANIKINESLTDHFDFKVKRSDIDGLGHVNNLRYTEYIYNCFSGQEVKRLNEPQIFSFYFHHEMTLDDAFSVGTNNQGVFQINNKSKNQTAFSFVVKYKENI